MDTNLRRRRFLQSASALGLGASLGNWSGLQTITPAHAADLKVGPDAVRFRAEIEPVVAWIEEMPGDRILDVAVEQLKGGLSYRDLLAAVFLAGIRDIKPHPVGFKFHAVLAVNSAHLLAQTAPVTDRLLPLFWALDNFKNSQARDVQEGDWTLGKVDESRLPGPAAARTDFLKAMEDWDAAKADTAVAALCRTSGAAATMEPIWRMAVRDQRNIGHKPIFAAQSWRTLQAIGWQHAEPVLRSLTFGLLDLHGDSRHVPVGPYEANLENAKKIRDDWQTGKADPGATRSLLDTIRQSNPEDVSAEVVRLLNQGAAPESLWDAVALAGNEEMMRKPGIIALHAVTSANSLHFIFSASGDDTTRRLALLQAAGWQPLYRDRNKGAAGAKIDALEAAPPETKGEDAVGEIFAEVNVNRGKAAEKALGYLTHGGSSDLLFAAARRMIIHKGRDSHDYKYGAAAWEECVLASDPKWRAPLAAAMFFNLPGAKTPDNALINRAREAIGRVLGPTRG
ncbi:MAG: hypothetical protein P4L84_08370 [Isosphaeraceae bacterium]|nr:hypothetical protein [Isosphaeraceae bacterium]